jgi:hypothetical protein
MECEEPGKDSLYRVPLKNGIHGQNSKPGNQVRRTQDLISAYLGAEYAKRRKKRKYGELIWRVARSARVGSRRELLSFLRLMRFFAAL